MLDCCTKPSHDLGRERFFHSMFYEMQEFLQLHNVKNILVACPSCYQVFQEYGAGLQVKTIYEHLAATVLPSSTLHATVTVHDPCTTRDEPQIHAAIRQLIRCKSLTIHEMNSCKTQTLCCGEGELLAVSVLITRPVGEFNEKRQPATTESLPTVQAVFHLLGSLHPTSHIIDLFFDPQSALAGKAKVAKAPWTYLYRLFLKRYFKKSINAAVSRERTFTGERASQRDCRK